MSDLSELNNLLADDPEFVEIVKQDLIDGQRRNPNNHPRYFTKTFFHHPEELRAEVEEAGLDSEKILAIEGPGWLLQNFQEHWNELGSARSPFRSDSLVRNGTFYIGDERSHHGCCS